MSDRVECHVKGECITRKYNTGVNEVYEYHKRKCWHVTVGILISVLKNMNLYRDGMGDKVTHSYEQLEMPQKQ